MVSILPLSVVVEDTFGSGQNYHLAQYMRGGPLSRTATGPFALHLIPV